MRGFVIIISCALALVGCGTNEKTKITAEAFQQGAEKCLLAVRDKNQKYDEAPACNALNELSESYIAAGGFKDGESAETQLIAEKGRTMAWMARAISASGDPTISLW